MRRGEVRFVDFEPVRGTEANKTRPAVIVSNDGANATADRLGRGVVTVLPLTSNTERVYAFQVLLRAEDTGLPRDSKVQAEQVRSIAVERIGRRVGAVPAAPHGRRGRSPAPAPRPLSGQAAPAVRAHPTGRPAAFQARKPPSRSVALRSPRSCSDAAARLEL